MYFLLVAFLTRKKNNWKKFNFLLQKLKENVVVSFKGDEEGIELAKEVKKVLPNSQKEELDEAGWNGILREQEQERQAEVEQIQLVPQYQSQQQSQMEL